MAESIPGRRIGFFVLAAIALIVGFSVIVWPTTRSDSLDSTVESTVRESDEAGSNPTASSSIELQQAGRGEQSEQREEVVDQPGRIIDSISILVTNDRGEPEPQHAVGIRSLDDPPIWLVEELRPTSVAGRVTYDHAQLVRKALAQGRTEVVVGVWDRKNRGFLAEQKIELADTREVQLIVPSVAAIHLRFVDVPHGFAPRIVSSSSQGLLELRGIPLDGDLWGFRPVPVGYDWVVQIGRGTIDQVMGSVHGWEDTTLPWRVIAGPQRAGELVHAEYRLADHGCALGRLVNAHGEPVEIPRGYEDKLQVLGLGRHSHEFDQKLRFESLGAGEFLVAASDPVESMDQLSEVFVRWQPGAINLQQQAGFEDSALQGACFGSARIPLGPGTAQLGDLVLQSAPALLEVVVQDEFGQAAAGVEIGLRTWSRSSDRARDGIRHGVLDPVMSRVVTNIEGAARLFAPSWEDVICFGMSDRDFAQRTVPEGFELQVHASNMVPVTQRHPFHTQRVALTLQRSGRIRGSLDLGGVDAESITVAAFHSGDDFTNADALDSDGVRGRRFELAGLPAGKVDTVFYWDGNFAWPFYRVRGVEVVPPKILSPRAISNLPLESLANWIHLELKSPSGQAVSASEAAFVQLASRTKEMLMATLSESNGTWSFPLPEEASTWKGALHVPGFISENVEARGPGRHRIELKRAHAVELRLNREVPGYGVRWHLDLDGFARAKQGQALAYLRNEDGKPILDVPWAGSYRLCWSWNSAEGKHGFDETELQITAADLERGYLLFDPPEKLK